MMAAVLEQELKTYAARKEELVQQATGRWVLIHAGEVGGVFDTQNDALSQGYVRYGAVPFLVKQIQPVEIPLNFTSTLLGI